MRDDRRTWVPSARRWLATQDRRHIERSPVSAHIRFRKAHPFGCPGRGAFLRWLNLAGLAVDATEYAYKVDGSGPTGAHSLPDQML